MKKNTKLFNYKGFSLLELMLVLGIIAAIIIGVFIVFPKVDSSIKTNQEIKNILIIKNGIVEAYAGKPTYDGALNDTTFLRNILPLYTGYNQWKGRFIVSGQMQQEANNYYGFSVVTDAIPKDACYKIVANLQYNFSRINVNGVYVVVHPNQLFATVNFETNTTLNACSDKSEIQLDYFQ